MPYLKHARLSHIRPTLYQAVLCIDVEGAFPRHVTLQDYAASEGVEIILQQSSMIYSVRGSAIAR